MSFLSAAYPWVKALHVIAVIAWMAGLLYLPRLFVYHSMETPGSATSETLKVMERRLLRAIMNPAMVVVFVAGGMLLATPGIADWSSGWLWTKLAGVAVLSTMHHLMARWRKDFAADANRHPTRYYRMMNEIPTLAMIIIVVMVIVRPF